MTPTQEVESVLALVVGYYAAAGIMAAGFAMMFGGPPAAGSMMRLFFLRPVQLVVGGLATGMSVVLGGTWSGFVSVVSMFLRAVRRELKELAADVHWLIRRFDR